MIVFPVLTSLFSDKLKDMHQMQHSNEELKVEIGILEKELEELKTQLYECTESKVRWWLPNWD